MSDIILSDVKEHLRVTWNEEDIRIGKMIQRGQAYLQTLCGTSLSFDKEDDVKQLLLERCRYEYNNSLEDFEINFRGELMRLVINAAMNERCSSEET